MNEGKRGEDKGQEGKEKDLKGTGKKGRREKRTGGRREQWLMPLGSLPLAVQRLGLPKGDHGSLLWGPVQGLSVARGSRSGPLGGW